MHTSMRTVLSAPVTVSNCSHCVSFSLLHRPISLNTQWQGKEHPILWDNFFAFFCNFFTWFDILHISYILRENLKCPYYAFLVITLVCDVAVCQSNNGLQRSKCLINEVIVSQNKEQILNHLNEFSVIPANCCRFVIYMHNTCLWSSLDALTLIHSPYSRGLE